MPFQACVIAGGLGNLVDGGGESDSSLLMWQACMHDKCVAVQACTCALLSTTRLLHYPDTCTMTDDLRDTVLGVTSTIGTFAVFG